MDSRYVNLSPTGRIKPFTECPYKSKCFMDETKNCHHEGVNHDVEFSCRAARCFDLDVKNGKG